MSVDTKHSAASGGRGSRDCIPGLSSTRLSMREKWRSYRLAGAPCRSQEYMHAKR